MQARDLGCLLSGGWSSRGRIGGLRLFVVLAGLLSSMFLFGVASADAAPKAVLGSCGTPNGAGGGQLSNSKGVAVNRSGNGATAGSVYVVDGGNNRISQFDEDCGFVRAWGFDVIKENGETGFEICEVATQCKAGVAGNGAGQLSGSSGVAIDQSNGYLYVTSGGTSRRVDVFSPSGQFAGAFGWGVDTGAAALEVCTTASICQAAAPAGAQAGNFQAINVSLPAIDPSAAPGTVYVPDNGNARVAKYSTSIEGGILASASFVLAFGWDVDPDGGSGLETCTATCKAGTSGNGLGQFGPAGAIGSPTAVAVDSSGAVYALSGPLTAGTCSSETPCRVQKFLPDLSAAANFGPTTAPGQLLFTSGASNTVAALALAIDPSNDHLFILRKGEGEGGSTPSSTRYQVHEYTSDGIYVDTHPGGEALPGPTVSTGPGLGVGVDGRVYSNLGGPNAGRLFVLGPVPPADPVVTSVEDITSTSARFVGTVEISPPGGPGFEAKYHFEYSSNGIKWMSTPEQTTGTAAQKYDVEALASDLSPNTEYQVRLVASTGVTVVSAPVSFSTLSAPPRVALTYTEAVTQTTAELGAHVDPEGSNTTYHFEWATEKGWEETGTYDRRVPAFERHLGDGNKAVIVQDEITGLQPASAYRFRVVATSAEGAVSGPDQRFETLNSCGLTGGRCFELVSPADKGPVGSAGEGVSLGQELRFQAAPAGDSIAYEVAYGFPDSTAPDEALYQADRVDSAWLTTQLSPAPTVVPSMPEASLISRAQMLSDDLACGIFTSSQPLTSDTPTKPIDAGFGNLFRRGALGEWTVITNLEPSVIPSSLVSMSEYTVIGASADCARVIFRTEYQYPGIAGAGKSRLYEWANGTLKGIASVPGPGGDSVEVMPGTALPGTFALGNALATNYWNAVSDDASRVYFTAVSREGGDLGKQAIFLREDDGTGLDVIDVSQSQAASLPGGSANNADSIYQTASADGSEVFFLGRYGLAPNEDGTGAETSTGATSCSANGTGCDLYRYSVEDGSLTDLSVPGAGTSNAKGASVVGVLGTSDDGSRVYFAARGQLVAGAGSTEAGNLTTGTYNIYLSDEGELDYVGRLGEAPTLGEPERALVGASQETNRPWSSRVTPNGNSLLFETRANVTGYDSEGRAEAYLYDASSGSTVCVSCRRDGQPSVANAFSYQPLANGLDADNRDNPPRTISDDGRRVFFFSPNRLASGATEGKESLYLWEKGRISFIADSLPGSGFGLQFAGSSASGDDIYFTTLNQLTWQDRDGQLDLYDARVGGGIPEPPAPPAPCNPLGEGACGGAVAPPPPALPPASSTFTGPGNKHASAKPKKKAKKHKKKAKKKKARKGQKGKKGKRGTKSTGRASK